ncbi:MAG: cadherin domain-containing protein [Chloroflexi bacterium]|nr:cadherin domain-containing protein [Chloroflexota bacterium]
MKSTLYRYISVVVAIGLAFASYFSVAASDTAQTSNAIYVSTTGSGTVCTQTAPCSLTTGTGKLAAGYTLFLSPGNYNTILRITKSGTASQPIKVTGAAKFTSVVLSGSYLEVYGLEVAGAVEHGVLILGKHIRFSDFLVHDNVTENRIGTACNSSTSGGWASGVKVERGSEDVFISNGTTFHNCGEGLAATMAINVTVSNVTSYDNFGVNFYIDNSKHVRLQNNFAYCTPNTNYYRSGQPAAGISIGEEYYTGWGGQLGDLTIVNNILYGCRGLNFYGVEAGVTNGGLVGALIAHNTIWNVYGGGRAISISVQPYNQGIVIANNIAGGVISPANATVKNNQSTAVFTSAPTYHPASFKTASNSPGINAGAASLGVAIDYGGKSRDSLPDVGAWEFAGNLPTVTPASVTPTATATSIPATFTPTRSAPTATRASVTPTVLSPLPSATPTQINLPPSGPNSLNIRIATGKDDVEEYSSGWVYLNSTDLELVYDINSQVVGLRFTGVNIPKGAIITNAYIQFKVDELTSETISLQIRGEANANAPAFTIKTRNVSSRLKTTNVINWSPAPWKKVGNSGPDQTTPNIAPVIQEIVNQPGWATGNSLVILMTGTTGKRVAIAFESNPAGAPLLHVEFNGNVPPTTAATLPTQTPTTATIFTPTATLPLPSATVPVATTQVVASPETLTPTETPSPIPPSPTPTVAPPSETPSATPSAIPTAAPLAPTDILLSNTALDENLPSALIGSLNATDADPGDAFTFTLVDTPVCAGPNNAAFQINGNTLNSVTSIDYETQNSLTICVRATDSSALSFDKQFIILVNNINELPTITSDSGGDAASFSLAENAGSVTTLTATDPDAGTIYTYSIAGGADADDFSMDGSSGALTFATPPDFESPADGDANNVYEVIVQAADGAGGTDSQTITVTVNAANDNNPAISSDGGGETASLTIAENTAAVTDVNATDADLPTETLTYSISSGADSGKFSIDGSSGMLSFTAAPDFESPVDANSDNVYEIAVQVSDGSFTDTQAITISVTPVNDNDPVIVYDEKKDDDGNKEDNVLNVSVAENTAAVTDIEASDADLPAETLTFSISGGADAALLKIAPDTGILTFINPRDFESPADAGADNEYNIVIQVTDGSRTSSQDVAIKITPVNDNTPTITSDGGGGTTALSIAENGAAVTVVKAKDADLPAETLTFSITGGADAALFTLAPATGVLTFITAPDFETPQDADLNNTYEIIVQVSDGNGRTNTQTIVVTITDIDETPSPSP